MKLSVIIITKNEAKNIAACIDSVAFADEVVVLDSGSSDNTCAIAQERGARVSVTTDWPGFGPQKNRALDLAQGEWVLSIDADERVTPALAQAIQKVLAEPRADAYKVARLSQFCGRWMRHSGWWPDHIVRLFKRSAGRFTPVAVHESVQVQGLVATLAEGHLLHYPYANLEELVAKLNHYSSEAAQAAFARGKRTSALGPFGHGLWTFIRIYVLRRGFLDGWQGMVLAGMAAAGSFFRYAKLYWLIRQASK